MRLSEISQELHLLAAELRGHDDLDQWVWIERLGSELEERRREILARSNELARRALPWQGMNEIWQWWV